MLIALGVFLYVLTASVAVSLYVRKGNRLCPRSSHPADYCEDHHIMMFAAGVLWVISVPHGIILSIIDKFDTESRHDKAVRQAERKVELAKIRAREIEALERAGGI